MNANNKVNTAMVAPGLNSSLESCCTMLFDFESVFITNPFPYIG